MKSLELVRSSRALVEPSHWLEAAISRADATLKAVESGGTAAPQDLVTLARSELDTLRVILSDEHVNRAADALERLANGYSGGSAIPLGNAARSLRTARSGPLSARLSS